MIRGRALLSPDPCLRRVGIRPRARAHSGREPSRPKGLPGDDGVIGGCLWVRRECTRVLSVNEKAVLSSKKTCSGAQVISRPKSNLHARGAQYLFRRPLQRFFRLFTTEYKGCSMSPGQWLFSHCRTKRDLHRVRGAQDVSCSGTD